MAALTDLTLAAMAAGLRAKAFSAAELAEAHIAAVEAARPLNAFIVETPDHARAAAAAADAALTDGSAGPLSGIPLGIKDLFATEGVQTTAGSKILEGFVPPVREHGDGEAVRRRGGDARQAQHGPVRHGVVERDERPTARWCRHGGRRDRTG